MATELEDQELYRLSCEILGHSADIRDVKYFPITGFPRGHVILTASRDGTACVWEPELVSSREYILKKITRKHTGYVSALCTIPADESAGRSKPLFATGGQDNTILVHSLESNTPEPLERYTGHKAMISSIIFENGRLISTSWDSTVRTWKVGEESCVIEAHKPAVWTVAGLHSLDGSDRILTGGADKMIRLWEVMKKLCVQEYKGHTDVVRDIKIASSDTFFSAANDCVIRKWSLHTGHCMSEFFGHEAYVYSLSLFPGQDEDQLASCGEDKTIRVWKGGVCSQIIPLPATSVWVVSCMDNGDIVSGSSDGVARIFTLSSDRVASSAELSVYDTKIAELKSSSSKSDIDLKKLPGREALSEPGHAGGQTLMINNNGTAEVYQWSVEDQQWVLLGNAVGKAPEKSNIYNGIEYDFVFDIELDEGSSSMRKLKLPYNKSTDPYLAAEDFLGNNNLPEHYLDQVAQFIITNAGEFQGNVATGQGDPFTGGSRYIPGGGSGGGGGGSDPFTGGSRYQPGNASGEGGGGNFGSGGRADPFTGGSSYRPSEFASNQPEFNVSFKGGSSPSNSFFPMNGFKLFTSPQDYCSKVLGKIAEFNCSVSDERKFTEEELQRLKQLSESLLLNSSVNVQDFTLIERIMRWPSGFFFPGLDLVRIALVCSQGSSYFISNLDNGRVFLETLLDFATGQLELKSQVPVLRALGNFFAHDVGAQVMHCHRKRVLERLCDVFLSTNRTVQIALSTIALNYCHYYAKSMDDPAGVRESIQFMAKILSSAYDLEAKFRALIGVGTMVLANRSIVFSSMAKEDIHNLVHPLSLVMDPAKVNQCSLCVLQLLKQ